MEDIHKQLKDILKVIDASELQYWACGGTLLGAVRHKDFIPWDDDADIDMLDTIEIIRLREPEDIFPAYHKAYNRTDGKSTILVEYGDYYNEK